MMGATSGAMLGALPGDSWILALWNDNIENGLHGPDKSVTSRRRLASLDIRSEAP
jgi:hypothetical protein